MRERIIQERHKFRLFRNQMYYRLTNLKLALSGSSTRVGEVYPLSKDPQVQSERDRLRRLSNQCHDDKLEKPEGVEMKRLPYALDCLLADWVPREVKLYQLQEEAGRNIVYLEKCHPEIKRGHLRDYAWVYVEKEEEE